MAKITAVCNQKGGVGKTVTTVNLGIGLAKMGKRVLVADLDAQSSLTSSLGYRNPDQMENTLATILGSIISNEPVSPGEGILHHAEGIDLMPSNIELSGLEVTLVNTMSRETILREYLNSVRDQYDVILLDCCPSLGMLTINALAAADDILIPCQAHYLSIRGMEQLIRTIANVKRKITPASKLRVSLSQWQICGPTTHGKLLNCFAVPMARKCEAVQQHYSSLHPGCRNKRGRPEHLSS